MSNCPGDGLLMGAFSSCLSALKLSEILCRDKQFLVSALKANICCSLVCSERCRRGDGEVSDQTQRGWWRRDTKVPSNLGSVQHCHGKTSSPWFSTSTQLPAGQEPALWVPVGCGVILHQSVWAPQVPNPDDFSVQEINMKHFHAWEH